MGLNLNSIKEELDLNGEFMRDQVVRFVKSLWVTNWKDFPHAYMNLFVEANRHLPYIKGHIEGTLVVILLASIVFF